MMHQGLSKWGKAEWAVLALLALAFFLGVVALDAQSLWADEMATVVISERDWVGVVKWTIDDRVHPPLYYLLMSPWMALGRSEAWLRYPSAMWGLLATALAYALGKRLGGRRMGVMGAVLLALSPLLLWHSRDARMYSMLTALAIGSSYFFVRLWDGGRRDSRLPVGDHDLLRGQLHSGIRLALLRLRRGRADLRLSLRFARARGGGCGLCPASARRQGGGCEPAGGLR